MSDFIVLENLTIAKSTVSTATLEPVEVPSGDSEDGGFATYELALVITLASGKRLTLRKADPLEVVNLYLTFLLQVDYPYAQSVCERYVREMTEASNAGNSDSEEPSSGS